MRFPSLTVATPRLHVRPLAAGDADAVDAILDDRLTRRWLPFPPDFGPLDGKSWCTDLAEERRGSGTGDHYGIVRREDDQVVGCLWSRGTDWAACATEVWYAVGEASRGYGIAAEALDALAIALILEHGLHRIEVKVASGNTGSRRVAEKAGFTYEGLLRDAGYVHSGRVDLAVWSLVAADLR
jgi:ribosomal-protein-alanine N-acetyltransferase